MTATLLLALGLTLAGAPAPASDPPFEPTDRYELRTIAGWPVRVHLGFLNGQPELAASTLALLEDQLEAIVRVAPPSAVDRLRKVVIWVEHQEPHHPCMCYHPDAGWLREHGMNPEKARSVEIANARNFLDWCRDQPWMVLHELAHAYHHQFLDGGYENAEVRAAFEAATAAGTYRQVLHINGREEKHYALSNPMEYFAEASEAYFGTNDFYPFVRAELRRHDRAGFDLLHSLWQTP